MNKERMQEAFCKLRPLCVTLTKAHTVDNVDLVHKCLDSLDSHTLQGLQEYVLFPLRLILKQSDQRDERLYEHVVTCMSAVLEKTEVHTPTMYTDVYNTLCLLVTRPATPGQVSGVSEELKITVVQTLSALMKSATVQVLEEVYQPLFLPALGHLVTLLLQMLEKESSRELRVAAIMCLMDLSLVNRKVGASLTKSVSSLFASFVPGLSMGLCKVITGDNKQGYKITTAAIEAWSKIISLVMSDDNLNQDKAASSSKPSTTKTNIPDRYSELVVNRSDEWVKGTAEKLHVLTQKIKDVKNHSNWRVRLSMVEWARCLLLKCSKSLEPCISDLLEVLVSLVGDDYTNVSSKSREALHSVRSLKGLGRTLTEILEDNLHDVATQLPRLIRTADDDVKLSTVKLFNGYIQLLGSSVNSLLSSSAHLHRISLALLQILELDCSSVTVIHEKNTGESFSTMDTGQIYSSPRKCFKLFHNNEIYTSLVSTCRMLGYYGDPEVLFDHFLDLFHQYKIHRKQTVLVLNHLCEGILQEDPKLESLPKHQLNKSDLENLIRSLLDIYLNREHLNLPTAINTKHKDVNITEDSGLNLQIVRSKSSTPSSSLLEVNSNVLQICLMLEGIGVCMKVLGKEYEYLLMDVLYPVLEKIGSDNNAISHTAYLTLSTIALSCQYSCIGDLLRANVNYLVNSISLRMRHLDRNPETPQVLGVILQYSEPNILPLVEDTIVEVLEGLDSYYEDVGLLFMKVLYTLTVCINKWYSQDTSQGNNTNVLVRENEANKSDRPVKSPEDVKLYLLDYVQQKRVAEGLDVEHDDTDEPTNEEITEEFNEDFDDEKEKEVPYHVQKLKQVLERCVHLMSATDPRVRLVTMDTTIQGLQALRSHQTELLPLVHKLWTPFIQRLSDEEMVVILKACRVLQTFADVSQDFIRQRLIKDVFPKLTKFLHRQSYVSVKAGPVYHHSMACKLQVQILQDLGQLCKLVGVGENHLSVVISATLPYLSCKQPQVIQQASLSTLKQLCYIEPDTVWLLVSHLYTEQMVSPPSGQFIHVKFKQKQKNEYSGNVMSVLEWCR